MSSICKMHRHLFRPLEIFITVFFFVWENQWQRQRQILSILLGVAHGNYHQFFTGFNAQPIVVNIQMVHSY